MTRFGSDLQTLWICLSDAQQFDNALEMCAVIDRFGSVRLGNM